MNWKTGEVVLVVLLVVVVVVVVVVAVVVAVVAVLVGNGVCFFCLHKCFPLIFCFRKTKMVRCR